MWKEAIKAVTASDEEWILKNRSLFHDFFETANELPTGKLGKPALEQHYEARLFKIFLSSEYDGLGLPLARGCQWIESCSLLHPSWGWLLAIGTGGAYFADYLSPSTARRYFQPREALVAGSGKPDGQAILLEEGLWQVSGRWSYCSGSEQASLYTAVTRKGDQLSAFILPEEHSRIERDWNAIGLRLTCSHSIIAEKALIPEELFFDLTSKPRNSAYPLSTYPFLLFALVCFVPVVLGITRAFWLETARLLEVRKAEWKKFQPERLAYIEKRIRDHALEINDQRTRFYGRVEESWTAHTEGTPLPEKEVTETGLSLAEYCYTTTAAILPKLGMGVLHREHPLQGLWQDLQTAYQHMVFHPWYNGR